MEPSIVIDRLAGFARVVEVAAHDVVAPNDDFSGLAPGHFLSRFVDTSDFDVRDGASRGGGDGFGVVVEAAHAHDAAGLGQPISGDDGVKAKFVAHAANQFHRSRRGAGDRQTQARKIVIAALRVREDRLVDRGGPGQYADAIPTNARQNFGDIKSELGQSGGAAHQTGQPARLVAEGMKEGVDDQVAVAFAKAHHFAPGLEPPDILTVGGHHALGAPGGPRGEDQIRQVVGPDGFEPGLGFGLVHGLAACEELAPGNRAFGFAAQGDDRLEFGQILPRNFARVVDPQEVAQGAEPTGPTLAQDIGRLGSLHAGVQGDENSAGVLQPDGRHHPLVNIRRPNTDSVARDEPRGDKGPGGGQSCGRQAGEIELDVAVLQGGQASVALGCALHEAGNRLLQEDLHGGGLGSRYPCFDTHRIVTSQTLPAATPRGASAAGFRAWTLFPLEEAIDGHALQRRGRNLSRRDRGLDGRKPGRRVCAFARARRTRR